jgi:hypothetical protein
VSPQEYEPIPVRPPSAPSRAPRLIWAGIALLCLVLFGSALGLFLWSYNRYNSKDLKKATSLTINYSLKNRKSGSVTVTDPAEVRALLDALDVTRAYPGVVMNFKAAGWVVFVLPDGTEARCDIFNQTSLNRVNWGQLNVKPSFYQKACDAASKAEGRRIDLMSFNN